MIHLKKVEIREMLQPRSSYGSKTMQQDSIAGLNHPSAVYSLYLFLTYHCLKRAVILSALSVFLNEVKNKAGKHRPCLLGSDTAILLLTITMLGKNASVSASVEWERLQMSAK